MKRIFLPAIVVLILIPQSFSQKAYNPKQSVKEARQIVQKMMADQKIPGLSVTITHAGKIVWSEGFGYADLENRVPVKPNLTKFRIGSVSKPITAAAMALLVEQGKLDLDAPVQQYVPYFPQKEYPITVRQVAGHIAGIRHYRGTEMLLDKRFNSVKESLSIFDKDTLMFEPGTRYMYSSYGWNLLSAVVEGASGEEFLYFMQKNVFDKLGLTNTTPDHIDSLITGRTRYYQLDTKGRVVNATYVDNSYKWAGGGFISTSEDVAKFANAFMKEGFVKQSTLDDFITSQKLNNGEATGYGVGWASGTDVWNRRYYGHTGGSVGGITMMRIYPAEQVVITILTNSSNVSNGQLTAQLASLFIDQPAPELKPAPEFASVVLSPCSSVIEKSNIASNTRYDLVIRNQRKERIQLFVVSEEGERVEDYFLKPGQYIIKRERTNISYLVTDKKGKCIGQFRTSGSDANAFIY